MPSNGAVAPGPNARWVARWHAGACSCPGCLGRLQEGEWRRCAVCRCLHRLSEIGGLLFAVRVPASGCAATMREVAAA